MAEAKAESDDRKNSLRSGAKVHVLNFFTDEDDGAALTVSVNGVGFHVIVDAEDLIVKGEGDEEEEEDMIGWQYKRLIAGIKGQGEEAGEEAVKEVARSEEESKKMQESTEDEQKEQKDMWCTCRQPEKDGQRMIACDNKACPYQWYHFSCLGLDTAPEGKWICPHCSNDEQTLPRSTPSPANDSGVDVTTPRKKQTATSQNERSEEDMEAAEKELQNWMLTPFTSIFADLAPASAKPKQPTLTEWYNPKTHFYVLKSKDSQLMAAELEETDELAQRMQNLIPKLQMPKYITEMGVQWYTADELKVIEESTMLGPLHPSLVRANNKDNNKDDDDDDENSKTADYFIKIVDPTQPAATKRELKLLHKIEVAGLDKHFNVPKIIGLVSPPASTNNKPNKSTIIGFLQTPIPSPVPLTTLLSPDTPLTKRNKWAQESQRIIRLLHEHDIVFGDCKADNFLVDREDRLWIIDFGGSYTEGWIEEGLAETREGDEMALGKIVGALRDPVNNTLDYDYDHGEEEEEKNGNEGRKRKRREENNTNDAESESLAREGKARKVE